MTALLAETRFAALTGRLASAAESLALAALILAGWHPNDAAGYLASIHNA